MRLAKALTALLLILALTGNLAALPSCAEQCALARHPGASAHHPAQPMAASNHSAHHLGMGSRAGAEPGTPVSVERRACSGHAQDANVKIAAATVPGSSVAALAGTAAAFGGMAVPVAEAPPSPPPSPPLAAARPLRI